jgi:hypothetical protein
MASASDYRLNRNAGISGGNTVLCTALMRWLRIAMWREPVSGTTDKAKRYCNRANECMQVFSTSQPPGTGEIYLLIAERYLLLTASERRKELRRTSTASHHAVP